MNPEQMLLKVGDLLDQARPAERGQYLLVVNGRKLYLRRYGYCEPGDIKLAQIASSEVNKGLTSKRWNYIKNQIGQNIAIKV